MPVRTAYLDPHRKLLDDVVDWLLARTRTTDEGVSSLAHVLVVVPTAQSGRNLRRALAARFPDTGLVPPEVVQPMHLVRPADDSVREATDAECRALFLKFLETRPRRSTENGIVSVLEWTHLFRPEALADREAAFALYDQLSDIWRILCGGGLLMRDVPAHPAARALLDEAAGDESVRWEELADFERAFSAFVAAQGVRLPAENVHAAKTDPAPIDASVEDVVLPALADPVAVLFDVLARQRADLNVHVLVHADRKDGGKFDQWGRPARLSWTGPARPSFPSFADADIVRCADTDGLARRLADDFAATPVRPALGLCSENIFPGVAAAFLAKGVETHNPERHRFAVSSLGRLVRGLCAFWHPAPSGVPWKTFAAVFRSADVLAAVARGDAAFDRAAVLAGLDRYRNATLPASAPSADRVDVSRFHRRERPGVTAFVAALRTFDAALADIRTRGGGLAAFLRGALAWIFEGRMLGDDDGAREFRAAAACVREVADALETGLVPALGFADADTLALARRLFDAQTYSLEPEDESAVKTEGWLELAWSASDTLFLAGFHEGAVPDSVIGHPFVPNALREALGLTSNETRLARDTWLFAELLASHDAPHAVRAYIARTDDAGDVLRPSRLLFLVPREQYAKRVDYLYGEPEGVPETPPRLLAPDWRMRLPDAVPLPNGRLSASAIDTWLNAPFLYLLRIGLGMRPYENKTELGFDDFGSLVHGVLESYAREQLARSRAGEPQLADRASIAARLDALCDEAFAVYGPKPGTALRLQLDAVRGRLAAFAAVQEEWAREGWRVAAEPEYRFCVKPFAGLDVEVKGSVDRIDARTGADGRPEYRIVDYKTWDKKTDVAKHVRASSEAQIAFAEELGLPASPVGAHGKMARITSVQLPLYGRCLECADPDTFAGRIVDYVYLVLGEDAENVAAVGTAFPADGKKLRKDAFVLAALAPLALETAERAVRLISANIFWPPRPSAATPLYDCGEMALFSPETDLREKDGSPCAWLARQEAKRKEAGL